MKEAILGNYQDLPIESLDQLQWIANTESFCYVDSLDGQFGLLRVNANDLTKEMLLSLDSLNALLKKGGFTPAKRFPAIHWLDAQTFRFRKGNEFLFVI